MPRSIRIKSLTDIYHTMIRGVNKNIIFVDDEDRLKFLQILEYYSSKYNVELFAYCLMDNHVHILVRAKKDFDRFMQCIQTVYAAHFNKKYKRIGHLFQDRFKSIPVEEEGYLLECVRYIHQNPLKAEISSVENYPWSSYNEYIKKSRIINVDYILKLLDSNKETAIISYKTYMNTINKESDARNMVIEDKMNNEEASKFIEQIFSIKINKIKECDNIERNKIISKIISLKIFSIRQISEITGIDRNIIRRM